MPSAFNVNTGQISVKDALDYETKNTYAVQILVSDYYDPTRISGR